MGAAVTLVEFANEYPNLRLELKPATAYQYKLVAKLLTAFHGKPIRLKQLTPKIVLSWLKSLGDAGRAATTVNSHRASILTLWRAAAVRKLASDPPNILELPKRRTPVQSPIAWSPVDLEKLLAACNRMDKQLQLWPDISRRDFWVSLILFLYESGARIGAALDVTPADLDLKNNLVRLRSGSAKTLMEQSVRLSDQTIAAIRLILDPERSKVWPCGRHRHELYRRLNSLLNEAGLPTDRKSKFHRIRRTTATQTAIHGSLEMAQRQLGHTSVRMTLNAYIDPRMMRPIQSVDVIPALHVG